MLNVITNTIIVSKMSHWASTVHIGESGE